MPLPQGREIRCRLKEPQGARLYLSGSVFETLSSLLNSTCSASLRYPRGIVPVLERGNRLFLTAVALRSLLSMMACIEKNPDTLPRHLQFDLEVWVQSGKTVLGMVVAGCIHLNRESILD